MTGSMAMKRMKPISPVRDQIPTQPTTIREIMARPEFEHGVADVRLGRGADYDQWQDSYWAYERGRQWARLVPCHVKLKVDGKVTDQAVKLFENHADDIL